MSLSHSMQALPLEPVRKWESEALRLDQARMPAPGKQSIESAVRIVAPTATAKPFLSAKRNRRTRRQRAPLSRQHCTLSSDASDAAQNESGIYPDELQFTRGLGDLTLAQCPAGINLSLMTHGSCQFRCNRPCRPPPAHQGMKMGVWLLEAFGCGWCHPSPLDSRFRENDEFGGRGVDGQRKCPPKWPA